MNIATPPAQRSADRVYDQVKAMAVAYQLRPGERINEVDLARQLSVSRTLRARDTDAAATLLHSHIERRLDQIVDVIRASFAEIYTQNVFATHAINTGN
jgi:DNA-binding GntR family transcriptional regulator